MAQLVCLLSKMDQADIVDVIDALTKKNRTVKGWDGKVSIADLGYTAAGIDEGWEGTRLSLDPTAARLSLSDAAAASAQVAASA